MYYSNVNSFGDYQTPRYSEIFAVMDFAKPGFDCNNHTSEHFAEDEKTLQILNNSKMSLSS